ncbi:MAG: DUF4397 domain-containing protein [Chitinophagales bacterium]|nr:DUF4397 domain-containing protein [Chitinophagales bacterium]
MRKFFQQIALGVVAFAGISATALAQTANVQVIHNCADPAAASVDVYVNGTLTLNNFAFRTATGFLPVPSGVALEVGVAPASSASVNDTIKSFTLGPLTAGENYVVVASGVVGTGFSANPDGRSIAFDLKVIASAQTASANSGEVDFTIFHGVTDAPGVDVKVTGGPTLATNARFGDATSYIGVAPTWYPIDIYATGGTNPVVRYVADLSGLADGAAVVFASGFFVPALNNSGPAFGLFAALANGTVVQLPVQQFANVQVIHNCADPAASSVDVYIDGAKALDNFNFRTATPFIQLLAGVDHSIAIAASNSTSVADAIVTFNNINLTANENYVVVASGVVGSGFAANPDGLSTAFDLKVIANAQTAAANSGKVDFAIFHGVTDAPGVDVKVTNGPTLATNARFGDATGYIEVNPTWYPIDIYATGGTNPAARYVADLTGLDGGAAVVFASGFFAPVLNNNGPGFGLFAALANGTVVQLPIQQNAMVQVLHNCADPAAASVDVYIDGAKAIDDFAFRTGTPFINLLAGVDHSIAVAPPNSTTVADALVTFNGINLAANGKYVVIASGVVGSSFAPNPDSKNIAFELKAIGNAQTAAADTNKVELMVFHGVTDAPTVDVKVAGGPTIVDNAAYGDNTSYIAVDPASYNLQIQDNTGMVTLATYTADVTALKGGSGVVLASGFLTPSLNNNGAAFGLFLALPTGGNFIALPAFNNISNVSEEISLSMFPNPSNGMVIFTFNSTETGLVSIHITDLSGRTVKQFANDYTGGNNTFAADLSELSNGTYLAGITLNGKTTVSRLAINR